MPQKYNKPLLAKMRRASREYGLIEEGDKIAVGLSGGKDSSIMLYALSILKRSIPVNFELQAITLDVGWKNDYSALSQFCADLSVPFHIEETNIGEVVFDIRQEKNPCSLCAKMRRGALHNIAKSYGCNKVALGHHLDDALETFLMSLTYEGRLNTFAPKAYLNRVDITLIRPMIYVLESDIIAISQKLSLPIVHNNCPADGTTSRQEMKDLINQLSQNNPLIRQRMQSALTSGLWQQYLIEQPKGDDADAFPNQQHSADGLGGL